MYWMKKKLKHNECKALKTTLEVYTHIEYLWKSINISYGMMIRFKEKLRIIFWYLDSIKA